MEKNLIIVRGIPGSGKTTFAKMIGRAICCADDWHTDREGNYNWKPENVGKAHDWCKRKCRRFMKKNINPVLVVNTSTTEKELAPYIAMAKYYGYKYFSVIVENRHGGVNEHGVPEQTLDKMTDRFEIKLR
jgi:predicted kinase